MIGPHGPRPLLITLGLDSASFEGLDNLRARYFPPDRNVLNAHVSLFHSLPPDEEPAIAATLEAIARSSGPLPLTFGAAFRLGGGFAVRVESPELAQIHADLARAFDPWLTQQDSQPYRPHVTLMNKADRREAVQAFAEFQAGWSPRSGVGESLLLWRYVGGPWEPVGSFPFGGIGP